MAEAKEINVFTRASKVINAAMEMLDGVFDDVFAEEVPSEVQSTKIVRVTLNDRTLAELLRGRAVAFKAGDLNIRVEKE